MSNPAEEVARIREKLNAERQAELDEKLAEIIPRFEERGPLAYSPRYASLKPVPEDRTTRRKDLE
jgi:hypothetical protein